MVLSWLADRALDLVVLVFSEFNELFDDELLSSPCNIFCLEGSRLPNKASA